MWLKVYNTVTHVGRVNSRNVMKITAAGSGSSWFARATLIDSSTVDVSPTTYSNEADVIAAIDGLILNGS